MSQAVIGGLNPGQKQSCQRHSVLMIAQGQWTKLIFMSYFRSMDLVQRSVWRRYDDVACIRQICGLRHPPFPRLAFH